MSERPAEREQEQAEHRRVVAALEQAGIDATDFGRFVSDTRYLAPSTFNYTRAVPVLLEWLRRVDSPFVRETLVRSLSIPAARPLALRPLLEAFRRTPSEQTSLKWAIGNALEVLADASVLDDLLEIALDPSHGPARQMVVLALGKGRRGHPRVVQALISLLADEEVTLHAISALRRHLGPAGVRPHVEPLLDYPSALVRRQAARELRKLDRALGRVERVRTEQV